MAPTACDRCSRRKEKCHFDDGAVTCRRCDQHGANCSFHRRQRRMGRRPVAKSLPFGHCDVLGLEQFQIDTPERITDYVSPISLDLDTPISWPTPSITTEERPVTPLSCIAIPESQETTPISTSTQRTRVLDVLHDKDTFYAFHRNFMIGRSFADSFQAAVWTVASHADGILFEAYQAALDLWDLKHQRVRGVGEVDVSAGTDCLRVLQSMTMVRREDAAAVLMVGQILLVYHIVTMCTSAHSILRSSLLAVQPFYDELLSQPELDPITITPILFDTVESLIRREAPVIKITTRDRYIVDRFVGLCWSFVPLLQEVCACSVNARASRPGLDAADEGNPDEFTDVENRIRLWEPEPPASVFTSYTSEEVNAMLLQARVYRLATLLIIHRLRYPLGVEDDAAITWANLILSELSGFVSWAPDEMKALPIGLPLLVAMLEVKDAGDHIMSQLKTFSTHPRHASDFRRFIDLVWAAREGGFRGFWFDLAMSFQMPIVP